MHAENLFIDYSSYWQTIETICESFPKLYIIPPFACKREERERDKKRKKERREKEKERDREREGWSEEEKIRGRTLIVVEVEELTKEKNLLRERQI